MTKLPPVVAKLELGGSNAGDFDLLGISALGGGINSGREAPDGSETARRERRRREAAANLSLDPSHFHFGFKIALVGDSQVGKSTLLDGEHPVNNIDDAAVPMSSAVRFRTKRYDVAGLSYEVKYWDCPGSRRGVRLGTNFVAGAAGVLIVFDVNDRGSFARVAMWLKIVDAAAGTKVPKVLVGNKLDIDRREVGESEAARYATENGMDYIECSARTGARVCDVFRTVFERVCEYIPDPPRPEQMLGLGIRIGPLTLADTRLVPALFKEAEDEVEEDAEATLAGGGGLSIMGRSAVMRGSRVGLDATRKPDIEDVEGTMSRFDIGPSRGLPPTVGGDGEFDMDGSMDSSLA
jgi:small GTP-binding protein